MTKNSNKVWLVVGVLFFFAFNGTSETLDDKEPESVMDYYLLLPLKFLPYLTTDSRSDREKAVRMKSLDGRLMKAGLMSDEVTTTLVLFKRSDGSDLVAVENRSCPAGCTSRLNLLSYTQHQWVDVTHDLLPPIDDATIQSLLQKVYRNSNDPGRRSQLIYTLQKSGASIDVNEYWSGMVLGQLEWANDAFTFKPQEAAGGNDTVLASTDNAAGDRLQIIGLDPESPATLPLNGHFRIKIAYQLKSAKYCYIGVKPVVLDERLPDDFTGGLMHYKPGSGVTTGYIGFNNQAHLELIRIAMLDEQKSPILTLNYNVDANWIGTLDCPKFYVECFPNADSSSSVLACMVYPSGLRPQQEPSYHWKLSNGLIASGQGTRRITVNLNGAEATTMNAEVQVGNLPASCERRSSTTLSISSFVKPKG